MNYEKQLNKFYSTLDFKPVSAGAIAIYGFLLNIAAKARWANEVKVANGVLMSKCCMTLSTLQRVRTELINNSYILYKKREKPKRCF